MKTDTGYWRKVLNMSQGEFAEFLGVSLRTVQNWDYRHTMPEVISNLLSKYYVMARMYVIDEEKILKYPEGLPDRDRITEKVAKLSKGGF